LKRIIDYLNSSSPPQTELAKSLKDVIQQLGEPNAKKNK